MKKYVITEEQLKKIALLETNKNISKSAQVGNRIIKISDVGHLIIPNKNGDPVDILLWDKISGDWNLKSIKKMVDGVEVCGRLCKTIVKDEFDVFLNFADNPNLNTKIIETGFGKPNIKLTKVTKVG